MNIDIIISVCFLARNIGRHISPWDWTIQKWKEDSAFIGYISTKKSTEKDD